MKIWSTVEKELLDEIERDIFILNIQIGKSVYQSSIPASFLDAISEGDIKMHKTTLDNLIESALSIPGN